MPRDRRSAFLLPWAALLLVPSLAGAAPESNPIVAAPKVNQLGYFPEQSKIFRIGTTIASTRARFSILGPDDAVVLEGALSASAIDDVAASGESVLTGDLSALATPGRYVVSIAGTRSPPFVVAEDVYRDLYRAAARTFYVNRCGVAVDDPDSGIAHAECHRSDIHVKDEPLATGDFTGGWHNAGDFGKWTHMASISASYMMWLAELGSPATDLALGGNAGKLLDQARWGLEWLLRMQRADGSVLHKVDSEPIFAYGKAPESDMSMRWAALPSSIDAADFTAVMLQASRVLRPSDPAFADTCRAAADRAWAWLEVSPGIDQPDVYYTDHDTTQEILWATAEMARATHDEALAQRLRSDLDGWPLGPVSWDRPELFGFVALATDDTLAADVRALAQNGLIALADRIVQASGTSAYGNASGPTEYDWGSVENVLHTSTALLFAHAVSNDARHRAAALAQLDYVLGNNALGRAFVTGFGSTPVARPYHWAMAAYRKAMPGWATGGPNGYAAGADPLLAAVIARGTPPAKCYVDEYAGGGSWASNEGQTSEEAALVFATGMLVREPADAAIIDAASEEPAPAAVAAAESTTSGLTASGGCQMGHGSSRWPWILLVFFAVANARIPAVREVLVRKSL